MPTCPICGGTSFGPYRGRENALCLGCKSKERARLMAMALRAYPLPDTGGKVVHVAPERAIADILLERYGSRYMPADFMPEAYAWSKVPVQKVDLTRILDYFPAGSLQGIVHSHVLEHLPGSVDRALAAINAAIAPGGFHLFQVPVHPGWYREDMDPKMPAEERNRLFFQEDHLRVFGTEDFADRCLSHFNGFDRVDLRSLLPSEKLRDAGVPETAFRRDTGHTPYLFIKRR